MRKLKILINGRILTHEVQSGVEEYAKNLTKSLFETADCEKIEFKIVKPDCNNTIYQHFWEHFILPFIAKEYDILFCPTGLLPLFLSKKTKTIVMIHSLAFKVLPHNYSKLFRFYYTLMTWFITKKATFVLTPSKSEMDSIIKHYPDVKEKIAFIHHGVSHKFHFNPKNGRENYILFVGTLSKIKNIKMVIEAFWRIREKVNIELKIVSPKTNIFKLSKEKKAIIEKALKDKHIKFIHNVSKNDLILLYQKAKLFLFPSHYESFGKPPVEAMSCGTPVIISNRASLPEVCQKAAVYIDPDNIDELVLASILILKNSSLQKKLQRLGLQQSQHYKWDTVAKKYIKIFLKVGECK